MAGGDCWRLFKGWWGYGTYGEALQSGKPTPATIPGNAYRIMDLEDSFHIIPLHPEDNKNFAFSVPVCD